MHRTHMHAHRQTHTLVQLQETFWSCFHPDCPSLCLLVYVRIYVHVLKRQKKGSWENQIILLQSHGITITGYFRKSFTSVLTGDPGVCVCVDMHVYDREMEKEQKHVQAQEIFELQHIPSFICTQSMTFKTLLESQEAGKIRKWPTIHW